MDRSVASSSQRMVRRNGTSSQRSTGDGPPAVDEFRGTAKLARGGQRRTRNSGRKKASEGTPGPKRDLTDPRTITLGPPIKPGKLISQHREVSTDRIADSDEDGTETLSEGTQPKKLNAKGTARYVRSEFQLQPGPDESSDDELSVQVPQTQPKYRDRMLSARSSVPQSNYANTRPKRSAESPDVLQNEHPPKRRFGSISQGDTSRTKFTKTTDSSREDAAVFPVEIALCVPHFAYPARDRMQPNAPGATNEPCTLQTEADSDKGFVAQNASGQVLTELEWVTPGLSKVKGLWHNHKSAIVKITKSTDTSSTFASGAILFIGFVTPEDAMAYVHWCRRTLGGKVIHDTSR